MLIRIGSDCRITRLNADEFTRNKVDGLGEWTFDFEKQEKWKKKRRDGVMIKIKLERPLPLKKLYYS